VYVVAVEIAIVVGLVEADMVCLGQHWFDMEDIVAVVVYFPI